VQRAINRDFDYRLLERVGTLTVAKTDHPERLAYMFELVCQKKAFAKYGIYVIQFRRGPRIVN
jgi:hypothetical protein